MDTTSRASNTKLERSRENGCETPVVEQQLRTTKKPGKIALGREKQNLSKLIFVLGNGKERWWKAFGHSAVIFVRRVAPLIGSEIKLRRDEDYNKTVLSKEGVVAYKDIKALQGRLEKVGCVLEDDQDEIYIFNLPFRVTEEEYNLYLRENEEAIERTNKILAPHLEASVLYSKMLLVHRLVFHMAGRMSGSAREMVGLEMERKARELIQIYLVTAKRREDVIGELKKMLLVVDDLNGILAAITGLGVDDDRRVLEAAEKLEEVRKEILSQMKLRRAKEIEEEQGEQLK